MKLHASGEDYLEAILMLQKKSGMVRSVDLARHMGFSKPSISHAVGVLRDGGFLTVDKDGFLHLTDIGREIAEKIYERHRFFTEQLVAAGVVPFPVSWTVKMKKKQKETQDILSYHSQAAGCSDKARAKASGGRQPIEECGRTGL